ncbi:MAG: hypothetical protein HON94_03880 [Methylococcales bacterium]|jgi:hypothetical protein|nr:hypothetical protein [Methylococcales bacterium]MBT7409047.1 hypothetical protein [Methylococcales bacterium]
MSENSLSLCLKRSYVIQLGPFEIYPKELTKRAQHERKRYVEDKWVLPGSHEVDLKTIEQIARQKKWPMKKKTVG